MAPTALTAPYRLTFRYTVGGLVHKTHYYLRCVASGDPMGFDTIARPGFANAGVSTLDFGIWTNQKTFYNPAESTFNDMVLEANVGGAWVYVAAQVATVVPTGSGTYAPAGMETWSGKDTANKNFPVYWYEKPFPGFVKVSSYAAMSAANKAIANAYFNAGGTAVSADPAAWRVSRGSFYSQRFLALITDSNQKLRRIRGIA